jgi:ATP synthase F1 complex assembly factor 2
MSLLYKRKNLFSHSRFIFKRYFGLVKRHWEHKRFYKEATVYPTEDGGYGIKLDHRNLRTPLRGLFVVPTKALATAVAYEWQSQAEIIQPNLMHLTALCNTVTDNPLGVNTDGVVENALHYLNSETLCYRATEPDELVEMQRKEWDPMLAWFNQRYSCHVEPTAGLELKQQTSESLTSLLRYIEGFDKWAIVGFNYALESCKSLILTCAMFNSKINPWEACNLSRLEARYQVC